MLNGLRSSIVGLGDALLVLLNAFQVSFTDSVLFVDGAEGKVGGLVGDSLLLADLAVVESRCFKVGRHLD